jgi:hypothetical protein
MLSSDYLKSTTQFRNYQSKPLKEKYAIQYREQVRVRRQLTALMKSIYNVIKNVDRNSSQYMNSPIIKYIVRNGRSNNFKYVSTEQTPIGYNYFGSDSEIYFASLLYQRPVVTIIGISDISIFNVFYWEYYDIDGMNFVEYLKQDPLSINMNAVLKFLEESNQQMSCNLNDISVFLMYYPTSYFLVGGRGHWTYAINMNLIGNDGSESESEVSAGGDYSKRATYNLRVTKKIKKNDNKYYNNSSLSKTTRKHKITRKSNKHNKHNKRNKKTIKYNNEL